MTERETSAVPLPRRGYLGFGVEAMPAPTQLTSEGPERWVVSTIDAHSPAEGCGLLPGDDLVTIDQMRITSLAELRSAAARVAPGERCVLEALRAGSRVEVELVAAKMPVESLHHGTVELDSLDWVWQGQTQRLRAIWTHPTPDCVPAKRPVVWLLPSAAWISQEFPLDPEGSHFQLISQLTRRGISTLRIDRSGLGDSEGPHPSTLDCEAELSMWTAGCDYFLSRTHGARRCVFGRSLGGMLAPLVAQERPIDAICVWGTSSLTWHEASLESEEHQRRLHGSSGPALEQAMLQLERLQQLVYLEGLTPTAARQLHPELSEVSTQEYCGKQVFDRTCVFFQQLQHKNLAEAWAKTSAEVLAVHAEYDIVVPQLALRRLAACAGPRAQFMTMPRVDHFMHERTSLRDAVRIPWAGALSQQAVQLLGDFFTQGLHSSKNE